MLKSIARTGSISICKEQDIDVHNHKINFRLAGVSNK